MGHPASKEEQEGIAVGGGNEKGFSFQHGHGLYVLALRIW